MASIYPPAGSPREGGVATIYQPVTFQEAESYLVFATVSLIPPEAVKIPIDMDRLIVLGDGELTVSVCGVEFDEAVLVIGGDSYTARDVYTPSRACRILHFSFTPPEYKCSISDISTTSECINVDVCSEIPYYGVEYVSTSGRWVAVRSKPSSYLTGAGNAFVVADYICFESGGVICKTVFPSECCYTVNGLLLLKLRGEVVAYSEFNPTICAFSIK